MCFLDCDRSTSSAASSTGTSTGEYMKACAHFRSDHAEIIIMLLLMLFVCPSARPSVGWSVCRRSRSGLTYEKAQAEGIATARLPINGASVTAHQSTNVSLSFHWAGWLIDDATAQR